MVNIDKELQKEFDLYSKLNEIDNTEEFTRSPSGERSG